MMTKLGYYEKILRKKKSMKIL